LSTLEDPSLQHNLPEKQELFLKLLQRTNWHILNSVPKQSLLSNNDRGVLKDINHWANEDHIMGYESVANFCYNAVDISLKSQTLIKEQCIRKILKNVAHVAFCAFNCFRVPLSSSTSSTSVSEMTSKLSKFRMVIFELQRYISMNVHILYVNCPETDDQELPHLLTLMAKFIMSLSDVELKTFDPQFWIDNFAFLSIDYLKIFLKSKLDIFEYPCLAAIRCLRAPTVDFRLKGAMRLSHYLPSLSIELKRKVVSIILQCRVLNEVCGERLHIEVLKSMKTVFSVIVAVSKWGQDLTQLLWLASLNRHSAEQLAIFEQLFTVLISENDVACKIFRENQCFLRARQFSLDRKSYLGGIDKLFNQQVSVHRSYLPRIRQLMYLIEATYLPVSFRDPHNPYFNLGIISPLMTVSHSQSTISSSGSNGDSGNFESDTIANSGLYKLVPSSVIRYTCHLLSRKLPEQNIIDVVSKLLKDIPGFSGNALSISNTVVSTLSILVLSDANCLWATYTAEELFSVMVQSSRNHSNGNIKSSSSPPSISSMHGNSDDEASQWELELLDFSSGPEFEPLPCPSPRYSKGQGLLSASFRPSFVPFIGLDSQGAVPLSLLKLLDNISNILCYDNAADSGCSRANLDYSTLSSFLRLLLSLFRSSPCPMLENSGLPMHAHTFRLNQSSKSALISACAIEFLNRFVEVSHLFSNVFQAVGKHNDGVRATHVFFICSEMESLRCAAAFYELHDDKKKHHSDIFRQTETKIESSAPFHSFTQYIHFSGNNSSATVGIPLEVSGCELVIKILTEFAEAEGLYSSMSSSGGELRLQAKPSRLPLIAALFSKFAVKEGSQIVYRKDTEINLVAGFKNKHLENNETLEDFGFSNDMHESGRKGEGNYNWARAPFSFFVALKKPQSCVISTFETTVLGFLTEQSEQGSLMIATHASIALLTILRACLSSLSRKRLVHSEANRHITPVVSDFDVDCEADPSVSLSKESTQVESIINSAMDEDSTGYVTVVEDVKSRNAEKEGPSRVSILNLARWMRLFGLGSSDSLITRCDEEIKTVMQRSLLLFIADGLNWSGPFDTSLFVAQTLCSGEAFFFFEGFATPMNCSSLSIEERFLHSRDPLFVSDLWKLLCKQLVNHTPSLCHLDAFGLHALRTAFFVRNSLPYLWSCALSDEISNDMFVESNPPIRLSRYVDENKKILFIGVQDSGFSTLVGLQTLLCRVILYATSEQVWTSAAETLCGLATSFSSSKSRRENASYFSRLLSEVLSLICSDLISDDGLNRLSKRLKIEAIPSIGPSAQGRLLLSTIDVASMSPSHRSECFRRLVFIQRRLVSELSQFSFGIDTNGPILGNCTEYIEQLRLSLSHSEEFNAEFGNVLVKVIAIERQSETPTILCKRLPSDVKDPTDITIKVLNTDLVDDIRARIAKSLNVDFVRLSSSLLNSSEITAADIKARRESGIYIVPAFWNDATWDKQSLAETLFDNNGPQLRSSFVLGSNFTGYAGEVPLSLLPSAGIIGVPSTAIPRRKVFLDEHIWNQPLLPHDGSRSERCLTKPMTKPHHGLKGLELYSSLRDITTSIFLDRHSDSGAALNPPLIHPPMQEQGSYFDMRSWKSLLALVEKPAISSGREDSYIPTPGALCGTNPGSSHVHVLSSKNVWTSFTSSFELMNTFLLKLAEQPDQGACAASIASESARCEVWKLLTASSPSSPLIIAYIARIAREYLKTKSLGSLDWAKVLSPAERCLETTSFSRDCFSTSIFFGATLSSCYLLQCVILLLRPPFEHSRDISNAFLASGSPDQFPTPFEFANAFIQSGGLKAICTYLLQSPLDGRLDAFSSESVSRPARLDHISPLLLKSACMRILVCLLEPVESFNYPPTDSSLVKEAKAETEPESAHIDMIHEVNSRSSLDAQSVLDSLSSNEQESLVTLLWNLIAGGNESKSVVQDTTPPVGRKRRERDSTVYKDVDVSQQETKREVNLLEPVIHGSNFHRDFMSLEGHINAYLNLLVKVSTGRLLRDGIRSLEIFMDRSKPIKQISSSSLGSHNGETQIETAPSFEHCIGIEQINAVCRTLLFDPSSIGANGQRALLSCLVRLLTDSQTYSRTLIDHTSGGVLLGVKVLQAACTALDELFNSTLDPSTQSADFVIPEMSADQKLTDYLESMTNHSEMIATGRLIPPFLVPSTSSLPRRLNHSSESDGTDLDLLLQLVFAAINSLANSNLSIDDRRLVRKELCLLLSLFVRAMSSASLLLRPLSAPSEELLNSLIEHSSNVVIVDSCDVSPDQSVIYPFSPPCPPFLSNVINSLTMIALIAFETLLALSLSESKEVIQLNLVSRVYSAVIHHCLFRPDRPLLSGVPFQQNMYAQSWQWKSPRDIGWRLASKLVLSFFDTTSDYESSFALGKNAFSIIVRAICDGRNESSSELVEWSNLSSIKGGYIGLKNQGATCYQNGLLQQLFFIPAVRHGILSAPPLSSSDLEQKLTLSKESHFKEQLITLRNEFQRLFSSMAFGNAGTSYDPLQLVLACDNKPPGFFPLDSPVRSQNDANEFFALLLDRLSKVFPSTSSCDHSGDVISNIVGGRIVNQMIGRESSASVSNASAACSHKKEREEGFLYLQLDVSGNDTIEKSLTAYVQGELLTGDNAYQCDECGGRKVETLKRCCISQVPDTLVLQLKRFKMDWNTMVKEKINDNFVFGHNLNLFPFTATGISQAEELSGKSSKLIDSNGNCDMVSSITHSVDSKTPGQLSQQDCQYTLRGVLVHSGSANSGHYYSFIKPRFSDLDPSAGSGLRAMCAQYNNDVRLMPPHIIAILEVHKNALFDSLPSSSELQSQTLQTFIDHFIGTAFKDRVASLQGKTELPDDASGWFEFNDEKVLPFEPTLLNTENKWFGGTFVKDSKRTFLTTNAFMLFYDRVIPSTINDSLSSSSIGKNEYKNHISSPLPVILPFTCAKLSLSANRRVFKSLLAHEREGRDLLNSILASTFEYPCKSNLSPFIKSSRSFQMSVDSELKHYSAGLLRAFLKVPTKNPLSAAESHHAKSIGRGLTDSVEDARSLLISLGLALYVSKRTLQEAPIVIKSPVGYIKGPFRGRNETSAALNSEKGHNFSVESSEYTLASEQNRLMKGLSENEDDGSTDGFRISLLETCIQTICYPAWDIWTSEKGLVEIPPCTISPKAGINDPLILVDDDDVNTSKEDKKSSFLAWADSVLIDAPKTIDVQYTSPLFMRAFGDTSNTDIRMTLLELLPRVIFALCVVAEPLVATSSIESMKFQSFEILDEILPVAQLDPRMTMKRKLSIWLSKEKAWMDAEMDFILDDENVTSDGLKSLISRYKSKALLSSEADSLPSDHSLERQLRAITLINLLAKQLVPFIAVVITKPESESFTDFFNLIKELANTHPLAYFCLLRNHVLEWILQVVCHIDPSTWNSPRRAEFDNTFDPTSSLGTECTLDDYRISQASTSNSAPQSPLNSVIGKMDDLKLMHKSGSNQTAYGFNPHSKQMVLITSVLSDIIRGIDLDDISQEEGDGLVKPRFYEPENQRLKVLTARDSPFSIFPQSPLLKPPSVLVVNRTLYQAENLISLIHSGASKELSSLAVAYQHLSFAKPHVSTMICSALGDTFNSSGNLNPYFYIGINIMPDKYGFKVFESLIGNRGLSQDGYGLIRLQSFLFSVPDRRCMYPDKRFLNYSIDSQSKKLSIQDVDFATPRCGFGKIRPTLRDRIPAWVDAPPSKIKSSSPPRCTCLNVNVKALSLMISKGPNEWVSIIDDNIVSIDSDDETDTSMLNVTCHRFGIISSILDDVVSVLGTSGMNVFSPDRERLIEVKVFDRIVVALKIVQVVQMSTAPELWRCALRLPTFIKNVPTVGEAIKFIYDRIGNSLLNHNVNEDWRHLFTAACKFNLLDGRRFDPHFLSVYGEADGFLPSDYTRGGGRIEATLTSSGQGRSRHQPTGHFVHGPQNDFHQRITSINNAFGAVLQHDVYDNYEDHDGDNEDDDDDDSNPLEIVYQEAFFEKNQELSLFFDSYTPLYEAFYKDKSCKPTIGTFLNIKHILSTILCDDLALLQSLDDFVTSKDDSKRKNLLFRLVLKFSLLSSVSKHKLISSHTQFVHEAFENKSLSNFDDHLKTLDQMLRENVFDIYFQSGGKGPQIQLKHAVVVDKLEETLCIYYPFATIFHLAILLYVEGEEDTVVVVVDDVHDDDETDDTDDNTTDTTAVEDDEVFYNRCLEIIQRADDLQDILDKGQDSSYFHTAMKSLGDSATITRFMNLYRDKVEKSAQTQAFGLFNGSQYENYALSIGDEEEEVEEEEEKMEDVVEEVEDEEEEEVDDDSVDI
jgi:ubiquitin C-terminal hydrolase